MEFNVGDIVELAVNYYSFSPIVTRGRVLDVNYCASGMLLLKINDEKKLGVVYACDVIKVEQETEVEQTMEAASKEQVGGDHYKNYAIQPAEFCQKNELNFIESCVVKYITRHRQKNGAQDIKKAIHFLELLLEYEYPENNEETNSIDTYQWAAKEFANYPKLGHMIVYPALGLAGEAGEVAEKIKKLCRDNDGILTTERKEDLKKELGDVLWYVSEVSRQAGLTLSEVAWGNIEKLEGRVRNGTLQGSGDNR